MGSYVTSGINVINLNDWEIIMRIEAKMAILSATGIYLVAFVMFKITVPVIVALQDKGVL
jgi:hypothetical protein